MRKNVLRLFACLLMLALLCGACLAEEGGDAFAGKWVDPVGGRAYLTIVNTGAGYDISIMWSSSAFEHSEWHMTGVYNGAVRAIVCEDCERVNVLYDENNVEHREVAYVGGHAAFTYDDGVIHWNDANEDAGGNIEFIWYDNAI